MIAIAVNVLDTEAKWNGVEEEIESFERRGFLKPAYFSYTISPFFATSTHPLNRPWPKALSTNFVISVRKCLISTGLIAGTDAASVICATFTEGVLACPLHPYMAAITKTISRFFKRSRFSCSWFAKVN